MILYVQHKVNRPEDGDNIAEDGDDGIAKGGDDGIAEDAHNTADEKIVDNASFHKNN